MNGSRFVAAAVFAAALSTCGPTHAAHAGEPARRGPTPPAAAPADRSTSFARDLEYQRGYAAGRAAGFRDEQKYCASGGAPLTSDSSPYEVGYFRGYWDGSNEGRQRFCTRPPKTAITTSSAAGAVALSASAPDHAPPIHTADYERGYSAGNRAALAVMKGQRRAPGCGVLYNASGPGASAYQRGYDQGWNDGMAAGARQYCHSR